MQTDQQLPGLQRSHHCRSEDALGSCATCRLGAETEGKGQRLRPSVGMRGREGPPGERSAHRKREAVGSLASDPYKTRGRTARLRLLPHLHQQMEVIKRLKMETRAGVKLCPGSLSQRSQESLPVSVIVKVTCDLSGIKSSRHLAGWAAARPGRPVSWGMRLAAATCDQPGSGDGSASPGPLVAVSPALVNSVGN